MKKALLSLLLFAAWPSVAHAATPAPYAGECGIPASQPMWAEFGWQNPQFNAILGKPGIVVGVGSGTYGSQMRALGSATVYFDLNLKNRVGTTTAPANPSLIPGRVKTFFAFAQQQTGCATPVIVLNELSGPGLVTPWSDNNAQYRANILALVQGLAALGAHPVLLLPSRPYTGGDAGVWWQQVAQTAELVREIYVPATATWKLGPQLGNRTLRMDYRQAVADFTSIGIPANKVGIMISFATTAGFGGRNNLQPASAWYAVAKWQALAAQQVAAETGIASVWSWGWGEWNVAEQDPDKPYAMCAWLWARSPALRHVERIAGGYVGKLKPEIRQHLIEQARHAAVEIVRCDDVFSGFHQVCQSRNGRHSAGEDARSDTAFQRCQVLFKSCTRRVAGAGVVVSFGLTQLFLGIRRGCENRRRDCSGRRIGFVSNVNRARGKTRLLFGHELFLALF